METVIRLKAEGHKVVLVSSGAIGVGLKTMNMGSRPKNLSGVQVPSSPSFCAHILNSCEALAAIGQGRLIALWDNLFGQLGQPIAQILLTRGDIADVLKTCLTSFTLTNCCLENSLPECREYSH